MSWRDEATPVAAGGGWRSEAKPVSIRAAAPQQESAPDLMGALSRTAASWLEGASGNTAHRWAPHLFAAVDEGREMFNAVSPADYGDRVKQHRQDFIGQVDPGLAAAGTVPLMMAGGSAAPALNTLAGIASTSALSSAGDADRRGLSLTSPEGMWDVGVNTALSTAIPYGLRGLGWAGGKIAETVAPAARTLRDFARGGYVRPTPEAQRLMAGGAELSLGRMDPNGPIGRLEELASAKASGTGIDEMRQATDRGVRGTLIRSAGAPGATAPSPEMSTGDQVRHINKGFTEAYDAALEGVMVNPDKYRGKGAWTGLMTDESIRGAARRKGAFELAAADKSIDATGGDRQRALNWLKDQATMLMPRKSGPDAGMVDATNLQSLRTRLGEEIDALDGSSKGGDRSRMLIYKRARSFVDEVLHEGLPPDASARLRAVDAVYGNKVALNAAADKAFKSGTEIGGGEFTAVNLLAAIGKNGGTEAFEQMSRDAHNVLTARYRPTGIQSSALDLMPGSKYIAQPLAQAVNTSPALRAHALGQTVAPWWLRAPVATAEAGVRFGSALRGTSAQPGAMSAPTRTLLDLLRGPPLTVAATRDNEPPPWAAR